MRRHASFDPDQAWLNVHKSRSNPVPADFLAQDNAAPLIQADHVKRVLAGIDPNRADNRGVCLAWHDVLLVLFKSPKTNPVGRSGREHGRSIPFAAARGAHVMSAIGK
jgi:hypothetical protein